MTIEELRELREKENMSYENIAELSGIPLEIVTKIFAGEIIDGKLHTMNTPNRMHQFLSVQILFAMASHIEKNNGKCHIYTAPLGVRLFSDDKTWVEPDILVVCKRKEILTEQGCDGAPDLIVEIVSPNNYFHDIPSYVLEGFEIRIADFIDKFTE